MLWHWIRYCWLNSAAALKRLPSGALSVLTSNGISAAEKSAGHK